MIVYWVSCIAAALIDYYWSGKHHRAVKGSYIKVSEITEYPENGKVVYLKENGNVRVFRQLFKEAYRYYIMGVTNLERLDSINYTDFKSTHDQHWQIECYHRALKQVCNILKDSKFAKAMQLERIFIVHSKPFAN